LIKEGRIVLLGRFFLSSSAERNPIIFDRVIENSA
jgi:hypothetical protein